MSAGSAEEGELAMRLLTRRDNGFQPRLIACRSRAAARGGAAPGASKCPPTCTRSPTSIVRLIESYTYLDLITGEEPDARRAEPILRMLLR